MESLEILVSSNGQKLESKPDPNHAKMDVALIELQVLQLMMLSDNDLELQLD